MKTQTAKPPDPPAQEAPQQLSVQLSRSIAKVKALFGENCDDLVVREFRLAAGEATRAAVLYLDGMTNQRLINDDIIKPLQQQGGVPQQQGKPAAVTMATLQDGLIAAGDVVELQTLDQVVNACLTGNAVLLVDGHATALDICAKGWEKRAITEPNTETVVRGPHEGFTENLRTNTAMIRRKIHSNSLKIHAMLIGKRTRTRINILFIEGIANPALVSEVERRLRTIDTDAVLGTGYLEHYIEDAPFSPFPTIWYTEKPDALAAQLLEGRVAIFADGTPFVLSAPLLFIECFQTSEDYLIRSYYATMLRILRLLAFLISLLAPAFYVSLTTFHQELVPTMLLFTITAASEGIPFPAVVETALMLFAFEILREAGVRMPRPLGQAISIVGALVMGQAAVQAGIVGAPVVIVIAITAVASFVTPLITDALDLLRWLLLLLAAVMGNFGIAIGLFFIVIHLAGLKSFGANYLAPFAPFQSTDLKDTFVRVPLWAMGTRPRVLRPQDAQRQAAGTPLHPAEGQLPGLEDEP